MFFPVVYKTCHVLVVINVVFVSFAVVLSDIASFAESCMMDVVADNEYGPLQHERKLSSNPINPPKNKSQRHLKRAHHLA